MKNFFRLPVSLWFLVILVSCSTDSPVERQGRPQAVPQVPDDNYEEPVENNDGDAANVYFGFLDGDGSSKSFIDMPIESSLTHLFVGRWKIMKLGIDEYNDGNIEYYHFRDFNHADCGEGFLQFNNDGLVFENFYYNDNGTCTLSVEIGNWELVEPNRFKIYVYDIIYLVEVTQTELVLKYDWRFENSLYAPVQVYYFYERM